MIEVLDDCCGNVADDAAAYITLNKSKKKYDMTPDVSAR
jgi:hypothetical protein